MIDLLKREHSLTIYRYFFPHWQGNGKNVKCFRHDDSNPSLSIYQKNGEYRHYCHGCGISGDCLDLIGDIENIPELNHRIARFKEIAGIVDTAKERKRIVKTYNYTDAEGNLVFQVVRFEPKDFRQRRPDPDNPGKWIYNLDGVMPIPYNLPRVIKSKYAFVVEGEKDCDTLRDLGFVASCNPMGAGKWKPEYNGYFEGKKVYILPDNDKVGKDHALQVAKSLKGVAQTIKIIELPVLSEKGDVSDWIAQQKAEGKTPDQIKEGLKELVKAAPEWTEKTDPAESSLLASLIRWNDILNLEVNSEYLLDRLIPKGSITLLFGRGGIGKTSLCLQIARAIAEGLPFGNLNTIKTPVYYIDFENPLSVLKQRVENIGHAENVYVWHISNNPKPPRLDTKEWELYKQLPPGLIIFDTLRASHLADENDSQDMAVVISRLKELREMGFTILLLHHTPKSNEGIYKGSTALLDLVDHCLSIEEIKDDDTVEFDRENIYRLGTRIKTRYEPYHIFLKFNPDMKGFEIANDPDIEKIKAILDILKDHEDGLKQKALKELMKNELGFTEGEVRKLLKKGEGMAWTVQKRGSGKENRALIYVPNFDWLIGQYIYSYPINQTKPETDKNLSNQTTFNKPQTLENACLVDRTEGIYPNNQTTPEAGKTHWKCQQCILLPNQRSLCEVVKPCPKGVEA